MATSDPNNMGQEVVSGIPGFDWLKRLFGGGGAAQPAPNQNLTDMQNREQSFNAEQAMKQAIQEALLRQATDTAYQQQRGGERGMYGLNINPYIKGFGDMPTAQQDQLHAPLMEVLKKLRANRGQ